MAKRYYWLKFQNDFFKSLRIKRLRKLAGGDTFTIIYLKLQLLALSSNVDLVYKGVFESFEEEMAEEIDEDAENIKVTIQYLLSTGLMEQTDDTYFLPYVAENVGSETASAARVRDCRARKALHCNNDVTDVKQFCSVEKEIDIDKERNTFGIKKESDTQKPKKSEIPERRVIPPTLEMVTKYCLERHNGIDPQAFIDNYDASGWYRGKTKIKDWQATIRTWESKRGFKYKPQAEKPKETVLETPEEEMSDEEWLKMMEQSNEV